jgi:ABC-type sugar transport system permease subunit
MLLLLSVIGSLQDYGGIYLLTRGGPGRSTYVPALEVYFNVSSFGEYGYASAIGLMLFVFIMLLTLLILRIPTVQDEK